MKGEPQKMTNRRLIYKHMKRHVITEASQKMQLETIRQQFLFFRLIIKDGHF